MVKAYSTDEAKWQAVLARDENAEGAFWTGVHTTGVYCRPGCPARTPKRENISFFETREAAGKAGLRPCKRCKADEPPLKERRANLVTAAVEIIEQAETPLTLEQLAKTLSVGQHHLHRLFKEQLGVTPKQYADGKRQTRLQQSLDQGQSVTEAVYEAGFNAPSRMYAQAEKRLGMAPKKRSVGGESIEIRYTIAESWLDKVLIAATHKGICCIQLGDDEGALVEELHQRFPKATIERAETGSDYQLWVEETLTFLEKPDAAPSMPLDIRGTAFQEQVWRALMTIKSGETCTYSELANKIGNPKAVRAVASACGANKLAVIIPCHRVIGKDGSLTGYRWGKERKQKLLDREVNGS